jgi:predicted RNase H-like nuclease (RuvC/YqgF family)
LLKQIHLSNAQSEVSLKSGQQTPRRNEEAEAARAQFEKEREKVRKLEDMLSKGDKQVKELKARINSMTEENEMLQSRNFNVTINTGR